MNFDALRSRCPVLANSTSYMEAKGSVLFYGLVRGRISFRMHMHSLGGHVSFLSRLNSLCFVLSLIHVLLHGLGIESFCLCFRLFRSHITWVFVHGFCTIGSFGLFKCYVVLCDFADHVIDIPP